MKAALSLLAELLRWLLFGCLWAALLTVYAVVMAARFFLLPHPHEGKPLLDAARVA